MKHTLILSASMFFSNALIMIFEIIGSRILGPYVGTSIIVWSSIIAIILFFISLGNYYGGKIADKNPNISSIHTIFLLV
jgi:predicted membrane-bound spermidine synthase